MPASLYRPSSRSYPERLGDPEYPEGFEIRRVSASGGIGIFHDQITVTKVLRNEVVGVETIGDGLAQLWFGPIYLGLVTDLGRRKAQFDRSLPVK